MDRLRRDYHIGVIVSFRINREVLRYSVGRGGCRIRFFFSLINITCMSAILDNTRDVGR